MKKLLLFLIICINMFCTSKKNSAVENEMKDKEILRLAKADLEEEDYDKINDLIKNNKNKEVVYILQKNKYIDKFELMSFAIEFNNKYIIKDILKTLNDKEKLRVLENLIEVDNKEYIDILLENKININSYDLDNQRLWEYLIDNYINEEEFLKKINFFIDKGMDLSIKNSSGQTILTFVLSNGYREKDLLDKILEIKRIEKLVNIKNSRNESPLEIAVSNTEADGKIIKSLIFKGADINVIDSEGKSIIYDLLETGDVEIVKAILNKGIDVNKKNNNFHSFLSYAASVGKLGIVNLLVEKGAEINAVDNEGLSPIHYALLSEDVGEKEEIVKVLLKNKNINLNIKDFNGNTLIDYAKDCDAEIRKIIIKKMLEINSPLFKDVLIELVENDDIDSLNYLSELSYNIDKDTLNELLDYSTEGIFGQALMFLIKKGADVKYFNENHGTYIFSLIAAYEYIGTNSLLKLLDLGIDYEQLNYDNENILTYSIITNKNEVAKMIIDKKLKKDWRDGNGETPLTVAAKNNNFEMINYILSSGGDINEADNQGRNALMIVMDEQHDEDIYSEFDAEYYLEKGIDIKHKDDKGLNVLSYAAYGGTVELLKEFVKLGLEPDEADFFGNKPLLYARGKEKFEYLLNLTKNLDFKGEEGSKLLQTNIASSDYEIFKILVEKGVPISESYLIDFAVANMEFYNKKIIEILLKNIKDGFNQETLFVKALYNSDTETMETLIERGYDINSVNEYGETAIDIAVSEDLHFSKEFLSKKLKIIKKK